MKIKDLERDQSIVDALWAIQFSSELLGDYIGDMEAELKEARKLKKSMLKKLEKGKEVYKKKYGREAVLKIK